MALITHKLTVIVSTGYHSRSQGLCGRPDHRIPR